MYCTLNYNAVQCAVFSVQCAVCSVQCAMRSVQCSVFRVQLISVPANAKSVCQGGQLPGIWAPNCGYVLVARQEHLDRTLAQKSVTDRNKIFSRK